VITDSEPGTPMEEVKAYVNTFREFEHQNVRAVGWDLGADFESPRTK